MTRLPQSRRAFLGRLAAACPAMAIIRLAHASAVEELRNDSQTLAALGESVLPSALGSAGVDAAVGDFRRWISEYREGAELLHGYGTSKLEYAGPTPATRWMAQLDALERRARARHRSAFGELSVDQRRALVREALIGEKLDGIPAVVRAPHVAVALLSHFYGSSAATDLCYQADIGRGQCRPLGTSTRKPLPIAARG
ncbi:MAG: gluconate 2-dehydrogenase subunit 3 family protein [Gemmatimonadaceae bacterium]